MNLFEYSKDNFIQYIINIAKYQKVVLVYDNSTNVELVKEMRTQFEKYTVFFAVSIDNPILPSFILEDTKCVIDYVELQNFFKLFNMLDDNITLVSLAVKEIYPRLTDKINHSLFVKGFSKNVIDLFFVINVMTENFVRAKMNNQPFEIGLFEKVLHYFLHKEYSKYAFAKLIFDMPKEINFGFDVASELKCCKSASIYLYLRLCAIDCLFQTFQNGILGQIDVYKIYQNDEEKINLCYRLLNNEKMIFVLKNQCKCVVEKISLILNKIKLKNKININKIKIELKNLKNNAKNINSDNLLKYCYLYNIL